jgi:putative phosphotransacetylase
MKENNQKQLIQNSVLTEFAGRGIYFFPVAVSARHVHLTKTDFETLFGPGKIMTRYKDLSQPGQFACEETVEVEGPKGSIKRMRVLGPVRNETQVEISISDSFTLGIKPEIRMSGNIAGTPGCTIIGPSGKTTISRGVIVAARHVHLSEEQAAAYGVKDGDSVFIKTPAPRQGIMENIAVRVGKAFDLEVHLDTDEANGNGILCGTVLEGGLGSPSLTQSGGQSCGGCGVGTVPGSASCPCSQTRPQPRQIPEKTLDLVTERDISNAVLRGEGTIYCTAKGLISPAAADRAREKGITLCRLQG